MARLSKHLRTETTERQRHEPDRHTDFCNLSCSEAYEKAHPVTDPHEFCDEDPCQACAEVRHEIASMRYDAFTDTLLDIARGGQGQLGRVDVFWLDQAGRWRHIFRGGTPR